jgi:hypothetical protein
MESCKEIRLGTACSQSMTFSSFAFINAHWLAFPQASTASSLIGTSRCCAGLGSEALATELDNRESTSPSRKLEGKRCVLLASGRVTLAQAVVTPFFPAYVSFQLAHLWGR